MRIIVNGQQAFGQAVLEGLLERGENVVGVYTAPDQPGGRPDPLKAAALERDLPLFQPRSFRREAVWAQMRELEPDLCVMAYVTLFVPAQALAVPKLGTIQYHPSLLPMHKGPSAMNWPIIFGERRTGLTIFWPDEGLDTGDILLRREVDIEPDDTLGSLYFDKLFPRGVEAMLEAVDLVRDGNAPRTPQEELFGIDVKLAMRRVQQRKPADAEHIALGSYESWCRAEHAEVDWQQPGEHVYDLIRGCNPQPGAWTTRQGERVALFDSRLPDGASDGPAGVVVASDASGVTVRTGDGRHVLLQRVRPAGSGKVAAAEWAASAGVEVGERLGDTS